MPDVNMALSVSRTWTETISVKITLQGTLPFPCVFSTSGNFRKWWQNDIRENVLLRKRLFPAVSQLSSPCMDPLKANTRKDCS